MKESHIHTFNAVYRTADCYYGRDLRPEFTRYFDNRDIAGLEALDLGCGEGRYSLYLAGKGCRVTAIDRSPEGVRKLLSTAGKQKATVSAIVPVSAIVMDIAEFSFPESRFDIIVAATVLDHLENGLRQRAIAGVKGALKPGGIVYINVFTTEDPGFLLKTSAGAEQAADVSETAVCMEYYFKPGELKTLFADFQILYGYEGLEPDLSHGRPHHHGWACLLAQKPGFSP